MHYNNNRPAHTTAEWHTKQSQYPIIIQTLQSYGQDIRVFVWQLHRWMCCFTLLATAACLFTQFQMKNIPLFGLFCCVLLYALLCCAFANFAFAFSLFSPHLLAQRALAYALCSTATGLDGVCCARSSGFQCITLETWTYSLCFAPGETRHFRHARLWRTCVYCVLLRFFGVNTVDIWIFLEINFEFFFYDFWCQKRVFLWIIFWCNDFWNSSDNWLCF